MENIYAALLLHKAGKEVNEENLKSVVQAAGVDVDESQIKSMVASLKDVDIDKELESASLAAPAGGSQTGENQGSKEEKKEEASEEESQEKKDAAAGEGLSALFG
ncbi:MAG TPA: 50S ribosomal protein P1 [Candidatus Nanoarchaeia archaeon]|nr:50S ribosomal protein P1 [Candidatus Nanoarchaeia archaeon]